MNHPYKHVELFIGGIADGKRIEVQRGYFPYYEVIDDPEILAHPVFTSGDLPTSLKSERYQRHELRVGKVTFEIYVSPDLSVEEAMAKLLNRYKRP